MSPCLSIHARPHSAIGVPRTTAGKTESIAGRARVFVSGCRTAENAEAGPAGELGQE